jgi:hypothetical protein
MGYQGPGTLRDGPGRFLGHSYGTNAHTEPKLKNEKNIKILVVLHKDGGGFWGS